MRQKESTSSSIICSIPNGATVKVLAKGDVWSKVVYENHTGYSMSKYLAYGDDQNTTTYDVVIHCSSEEERNRL